MICRIVQGFWTIILTPWPTRRLQLRWKQEGLELLLASYLDFYSRGVGLGAGVIKSAAFYAKRSVIPRLAGFQSEESRLLVGFRTTGIPPGGPGAPRAGMTMQLEG